MSASAKPAPGSGWKKGDPAAALRQLESMQRPMEQAWLATPCETHSYELIVLAQRWLPLRETINNPDLDEGHMHDELLQLRAVLVGAKSVPDACAEALPHLEEALSTLATIWQHFEDLQRPGGISCNPSCNGDSTHGHERVSPA